MLGGAERGPFREVTAAGAASELLLGSMIGEAPPSALSDISWYRVLRGRDTCKRLESLIAVPVKPTKLARKIGSVCQMMVIF